MGELSDVLDIPILEEMDEAVSEMVAEAYTAMKQGLAVVYINIEIARAKRRKLNSQAGNFAVACTWAAFTFFVWVYGIKMYKFIGKGSEFEFAVQWTRVLLLDNLVFAWKTSVRNAVFTQVIGWIASTWAVLVDPMRWFEGFDDEVMLDVLEVEGVDAMNFDDLEAFDFLEIA